MLYFVFNCLLRPTAKNAHRHEVKGAHSHTWVKADSLETARVRVFDFYADSEWLLEKIVNEQQAPLELHPRNQRSTQPQDEATQLALETTYQRLLVYGIGSELFAFREEKAEEA